MLSTQIFSFKLANFSKVVQGKSVGYLKNLRFYSKESEWDAKIPSWNPVKAGTEDKYGRNLRRMKKQLETNLKVNRPPLNAPIEELENFTNRRDWEIRLIPVYSRVETGQITAKKIRSDGFLPGLLRHKKGNHDRVLIKVPYSFVRSEIDRGGLINRLYYLDMDQSGKHILVRCASFLLDHRWIPMDITFFYEKEGTPQELDISISVAEMYKHAKL